MAEEKNEKIKSALDEIGTLTGDAEIQRMAELRDKWERDRISEISYATKKGIEKGVEKGERKAKIEAAKKLLESGVSVEIIANATGLTKEEITGLNI